MIYSFVAFGLIALLGVSAFVSANPGFGQGIGFGQDLTDEEKAEIQAKRDAMRNAVESQDYETWKSLMEERVSQLRSKITEENFNKIVERHKQRSEMRAEMKSLMEDARESRDFSQVKQFIQDNNLEGPMKRQFNQRFFSD